VDVVRALPTAGTDLPLLAGILLLAGAYEAGPIQAFLTEHEQRQQGNVQAADPVAQRSPP
jgi:hypothetical protein